MGIQKDALGNTMISPRFDNTKVCKRNNFDKKPIRKMMNLQEIKDMYQVSVLCQTTRRAKENGAFFHTDYCDGKIENILQTGEHEVFERLERKFLKKQRA